MECNVIYYNETNFKCRKLVRIFSILNILKHILHYNDAYFFYILTFKSGPNLSILNILISKYILYYSALYVFNILTIKNDPNPSILNILISKY